MGFTLLESMACGTPAICSRVGAMPEYVNDGETGFVFDTDDELDGAAAAAVGKPRAGGADGSTGAARDRTGVRPEGGRAEDPGRVPGVVGATAPGGGLRETGCRSVGRSDGRSFASLKDEINEVKRCPWPCGESPT